jgi:hypothetical protein
MKKIAVILVLLQFVLSCSLFKSSIDIDLIPFEQKGKYGYFDLEGKIVINPQFDFATAFREDLALVKLSGDNGKWGYIDKKGKFVINATYKDDTVFQDGLAWVVTDNAAPSAINKDGEIKFTLKQANNVNLFSEGLAGFSVQDTINNETWGFVDKTGSSIVNPQFFEIGDFSESKCAVKNKEGKWGFIDKSGKIIINYQFDEVEKFNNGKAVVYIDNKAGVIDEDGKYIINPQYKFAKSDGKLFLISQDDKFGWCDQEGKFVINPQFDYAQTFSDSKLACIESGNKYGYIDDEAKILINPQFDYASPFFGKVALVKLGDKFGLIDEEGKYKVNPQFEGIGYDIFELLNHTSLKNSITSDYLDVNAILNLINIDRPENLSFNDGFNTIISKLNKTANDFSAYETNHSVFTSKKINNDADYSFMFTGNVKALNNDSYEFYITDEKPQTFVYIINLHGKAYGKAESIQKALENKLTGFTNVKKGFAQGRYASIYKGPNSYVITWSTGSSQPLFYICNKNFDITHFSSLIVSDKESSVSEASDYVEEPAYEEAAPVADTAYSGDAY